MGCAHTQPVSAEERELDDRIVAAIKALAQNQNRKCVRARGRRGRRASATPVAHSRYFSRHLLRGTALPPGVAALARAHACWLPLL
jgi:hypothetical protein